MTSILASHTFRHCYDDEDLEKILGKIGDIGQDYPYVQVWDGPDFGKTLSIRRKVQFYSDPELQSLVLSRLPRSIRDVMIVNDFAHLRSFIPYQVHCDYGALKLEKDEASFLALIIPLETVPARTITFDQIARYNHFVDYKKNHDPLPSDQCITQEVYDRYFSHCWPEERPYLSIDSMFEWEKGSVFVFDLQRFHSSDNYLSNGITEKNCVLIRTKIKSDDLLAFQF